MTTNNNFYSIADFAETISLLGIKKVDIKKVVRAWGNTNGSSREDSGTELNFGALLELNNGKFVYISGWNDYTGWGCQDGTDIKYADNQDDLLKDFDKDYFDEITWDEEPIDLNEWVQGKRKLPDWYCENNY